MVRMYQDIYYSLVFENMIWQKIVLIGLYIDHSVFCTYLILCSVTMDKHEADNTAHIFCDRQDIQYLIHY